MTSTSASSRKNQALSKIACNRLQKELVEWLFNPPAGFKHKPTDNLQRWVIEAKGAPGTLYSNETFQLEVDFPEHYPMEAPQFQSSINKAELILFGGCCCRLHVYDSSPHIRMGFHALAVPWYISRLSDGFDLTKYISLGYKSCIERRSKRFICTRG